MKLKMVQEQWLQVKYLLSYNMEIFIQLRGKWTFGGGDKNMVVMFTWGVHFSWWGEMSNFLASGEGLPQ